MPSSMLAHVAIFSVGAALGAGIATGVASRKQAQSAAAASTAPMQVKGPLVETKRVGPQGVVQLSPALPGDVLRYGNPGPISDFITRKAYVAGYDRRMRHPAWTAEHLTRASLAKGPDSESSKGDRSQSNFAEDSSIPVPFHVFVFTVPLYLPKQDSDGKYRVTYEVIGNPPNVAVPTHFAKVVLGSRPASPATPQLAELSVGAFVLPNAEIPDETPLTKFVVPVEAVERAAGLALFSEDVKKSAKHICQTTKCEVIVRRFDDAQQQTRKAITAPK
ncbi:nuclease [Ceratobasidium sp. 370]|nr:nuclease [Ceratobasidium sp. 370]